MHHRQRCLMRYIVLNFQNIIHHNILFRNICKVEINLWKHNDLQTVLSVI